MIVKLICWADIASLKVLKSYNIHLYNIVMNIFFQYRYISNMWHLAFKFRAYFHGLMPTNPNNSPSWLLIVVWWSTEGTVNLSTKVHSCYCLARESLITLFQFHGLIFVWKCVFIYLCTYLLKYQVPLKDRPTISALESCIVFLNQIVKM